MNRIDELNSKLNNPLYKELEDIDVIDEVSKYESTESLRQLDTIKNRVDGIITSQNNKLDTLVNKEHDEDLEHTLTKLNHDVDNLIEKVVVNNTIEFQKENFNMTSSSLNIDDDLLKRMDKKVNQIEDEKIKSDIISPAKDSIDPIIVNEDTYDFTMEDLKVENNQVEKVNKGVDIVSIIFIIIMLGIIASLIYIIFFT